MIKGKLLYGKLRYGPLGTRYTSKILSFMMLLLYLINSADNSIPPCTDLNVRSGV